ncbi:response regulator transcription factor [Luteibaculum oceani]|uniref:Response regulator transcription factor n=1 Tax=Luteibaculum oceani TaxID=1294296 RepID=A0A5C6VAV5_9FLAO|nr:response regulator transcription factor [Luteibaculum oceani]TXC81506.1 response regulator transcription factor [Luteibaculum oceani]
MASTKKILFVEDEEHLQSVISLNLELEGYQVVCAQTGEEAIKLYSNSKFDLVILDVMLPEIDGYAVCEHIRLKDSYTPVMFLSARSSPEERKRGLKLGADDYLPKPFDLEELLLRVKRLLFRTEKNVSEGQLSRIEIGEAVADFEAFVVRTKNGEERHLTPKEAMVLKMLISRKGEAINRNEILDVVWGNENPPGTRTIDNFLVQFRKDFEPDPKNPQYFKSVHGVGYRLVLD